MLHDGVHCINSRTRCICFGLKSRLFHEMGVKSNAARIEEFREEERLDKRTPGSGRAHRRVYRQERYSDSPGARRRTVLIGHDVVTYDEP